MKNELLLSIELKLANVNVYTNRIEILHKGVRNMFVKGIPGNIIISLKHLDGIFYTKGKKGGRIEFITASMPHSENMLLAVQRENQVELTKKDKDEAEKLVKLIKELL